MTAIQEDAEVSLPPESATSVDETRLVEALRKGDENAFVMLLDRYHTAMVNLTMAYVPGRAVAEEVAQEAWLGVLQGIGRFEGRCSLKTWIFRILVNRAKTRGERESRSVPFSSLTPAGEDEPAVDPQRFLADRPAQPAAWADPPPRW